MNKHFTFLGALALSAGLTLQAQNVNQLVVQANKLGAEIQPTLYGHFFEDINFGADGGLYAELIKNRSFEFPDKFASETLPCRMTDRSNVIHTMYVWAIRDTCINIPVWRTEDSSASA